MAGASTTPVIGSAQLTNRIVAWLLRGGFKPQQYQRICDHSISGGKSHTIEGVRLATWYDTAFGVPTGVKDFEVWVSNTTPDDISFTKVLTATAPFVRQCSNVLVPRRAVQARYVKYVPLTNAKWRTTINTVALM